MRRYGREYQLEECPGEMPPGSRLAVKFDHEVQPFKGTMGPFDAARGRRWSWGAPTAYSGASHRIIWSLLSNEPSPAKATH